MSDNKERIQAAYEIVRKQAFTVAEDLIANAAQYPERYDDMTADEIAAQIAEHVFDGAGL